MKSKIAILILSLISLVACEQGVSVIKIDELERIISSPSDKIKVINFWATWCPPCVKELPLFEQAHLHKKDVQVSLVSLDLNLDPDLDKVHLFVSKEKIKSPVYILEAGEANSWIDKIDKNWSGAIPATLFVNTQTGKRKFVEGELNEIELDKWVAYVK